eukprot:CCRYP_008703-RA/>CCRYP_008703-RA protein AED:0.03 eAED:0.03 QI:64/1/1/1/1/1/2/579/295
MTTPGDKSHDKAASSLPLLTINNVPIHLLEDWNTGIGGGLWSTGLAMAKYFERHSAAISENLNFLARLKLSHARTTMQPDQTKKECCGISAIELGSGNGFLSVCLLAVMAGLERVPLKTLVITDMADHLHLIRNTFHANSHTCDRMKIVEASSGCESRDGAQGPEFASMNVHYASESNQLCQVEVIVAEHVWGSFEQPEETDLIHEKYDFIFGTDLAYREYLYKPLIASLLKFSHAHTLSLIGVTMNDTHPLFFELLTAAGFQYERLADHLLEGEFQSCGNFGVFAIQKRKSTIK